MQQVSHASDNIHDDSEWDWSDTDDLVFLSEILVANLYNASPENFPLVNWS